jgi:hypothetical protein
MDEDIPIFGCALICVFGAGEPMLRILAKAGGKSNDEVGE